MLTFFSPVSCFNIFWWGFFLVELYCAGSAAWEGAFSVLYPSAVFLSSFYLQGTLWWSGIHSLLHRHIFCSSGSFSVLVLTSDTVDQKSYQHQGLGGSVSETLFLALWESRTQCSCDLEIIAFRWLEMLVRPGSCDFLVSHLWEFLAGRIQTQSFLSVLKL